MFSIIPCVNSGEIARNELKEDPNVMYNVIRYTLFIIILSVNSLTGIRNRLIYLTQMFLYIKTWVGVNICFGKY